MTFAALRAHVGTDGNFNGAYWMAGSLDEMDYLYELVIDHEPDTVIELGSGMGVTGRFIAEALAYNRHGHLISFEPNDQYALQAAGMLRGLPADVIRGDCDLDAADMVFIDSGENRGEHIRRWLTNGSGALVVVHDANRRYPELALGDGYYREGADGIWVGRGG